MTAPATTTELNIASPMVWPPGPLYCHTVRRLWRRLPPGTSGGGVCAMRLCEVEAATTEKYSGKSETSATTIRISVGERPAVLLPAGARRAGAGAARGRAGRWCPAASVARWVMVQDSPLRGLRGGGGR